MAAAGPRGPHPGPRREGAPDSHHAPAARGGTSRGGSPAAPADQGQRREL
jgi:hypothetical protein